MDNGLSVELVGITSGIGKSAFSWKPDGLQMAEPLYGDHSGNLVPEHPDTQSVREFALRLTYPPTTSVELMPVIPGSVGISWGSGPAFNNNALVTDEREFSKETGGFRVISAVFPKTLTQATVRVGLAGGPWRTDASGRTDGPSGYHITNRDGSLDEILFGKPFPSGGRYVLTVSDTYVKQDYRIVAVGVNGHVTDLHDRQEQNGQKFRVTTVTFDLPLNQIKEFRFQTRPYQWVEFRNIPLQPRGSQGSQL
ncbi:MAG: hypothetical protein M3Y28_12260 [Armatimonadota bacterium]|nr:hypothetical protein [Armatimonadota bacterium]